MVSKYKIILCREIGSPIHSGIDFIHQSDPVMSKLILAKFSRHLWYLSEEAVGLSFFDDKIPLAIKRKMVRNLRLNEGSDSSEVETTTSSSADSDVEEEDIPESARFEFVENDDDELASWEFEEEEEEKDDSNVSSRDGENFEECQHKLLVDVDEIIQTYSKKDLSDFVTRKTAQFFRRFQISMDFLETDPANWKSDKNYQDALELVTKLKVVHDTAERGVYLMSTYNQMLTKNEKEMQFILQVVEFYRKKYKSHHIKDLVKN